MEAAYDYKALGFMCGLEIHQRLATKEKLFCSCRADLFNDKKVLSVMRKQRAVAGELGKIDAATAFESRKGRSFMYNVLQQSSCLVDSDEEPPHQPNPEAIEAALTIASSLNASVPNEIQVMRKGVVDGSDPSAFQRTMMIGYWGSLDVGKKKIPITSIFLEEESGGIVKSGSETVEYNLDRLGIPLIEIDTDPVIENPQQAKEVAMRIGLLVRLTGTAQRGIGSIRQDVNVSIRDGARVEVKGFQELEIMDKVIENEVRRQLALVEISKILKSNKASAGKPKDVTKLFKSSKAKIISQQVSAGGSIIGIKLNGFKGIIGTEINPDLRLGSEISEYAKMAGVKGLIHSDENLSSSYSMTPEEIKSVNSELELGANDAFILIAEKSSVAMAAANLACDRAEQAIKGVPSETRAVDATRISTRFLRPMPGGARMYPETDILPVLANDMIKKAHANKVDVEEIRKQLHNQIKNDPLADQMLWSKQLQFYRKITNETDVNPAFVSSILLDKFRELSRNKIDVDSIPDDVIVYMFKLYSKEKITKAAIGELLSLTPISSEDVDSLIKTKSLERISGTSLKKIVSEIKGKDKGSAIREIMQKYKLTVDGEELNKII